MNYEALRELLGMLENYGANIVKIDVGKIYADVYFETYPEEKYENLLNVWNCEMHPTNGSYVRFYLTCNNTENKS